MNYRNLLKQEVNYSICLFMILPILFLSMSQVSAVSVEMQETDLSPSGEASTFHIASDNSILLVDDNNELWVFNAVDWQYIHYEGVGGDNLADIAIESPTKIWWTDNGTSFGSLDLNTHTFKVWEVSESTTGNIPNLGPIVFAEGFVWMPTWFGTTFGLFRFNISSETLDLFPYTGGSFAADMVYSDGILWSLDWSKQSLMKFDIDTGALVKITPNPAREIYDTANVQVDGSTVWWTEDKMNGAVISYDSGLSAMAAYQLPENTDPRNLCLQDGLVWYSNENGTIGRIDPDQATSASLDFMVTTYPEEITPESYDVTGPITSTISSPSTGGFSFTGFDSDFSEGDGLQVYTLPESAVPWGIIVINDFVIVADNGRQKLIRFPLEDLSGDEEFQYLPLILMQ